MKLARVCLSQYPDTNKSLLAKTLDLNRTTLYLSSIRDKLDNHHREQIQSLLQDNPCYGHRRVAIELAWSNNKARRIMRKFNLYPHYKKPRYLIKKNDLGKSELKTPNLLKSLNQLTRPNQAWSADFTYLTYNNSFLYLATIIDTFSKDIVGFEVSNRHNQNLITKALNMAVKKYGIPNIFHSDQGSEYTAYDYQKLLSKLDIQISLSKKASPWENGYQESFYGKFKWELGKLNKYQNLELAISAIYRQIYYYNHCRIHTAIKDIPSRFRQNYYKGLKAPKATTELQN